MRIETGEDIISQYKRRERGNMRKGIREAGKKKDEEKAKSRKRK